MTEDCKKWLCELAEYGPWIWDALPEEADDVRLAILIKAMWAINREGKWWITMYPHGIHLKLPHRGKGKDFEYKDYNNSETEALAKALEYIFEQDSK